MARNAEKAMTTLARWRAAKEQESGDKERRPYLASECTDLGKCEKYRLEIIREISKKVSQIQNAGLGEFRIRDLNDEINKLLREKRHWENQISALGGPHYRRYGPRMFDSEGREVPGNRGYKYFGAAKDLPGVRELFEQEPPPPPRKTRAELMKDIDAEYYGYRDDDDGILIPLEEKVERLARREAVRKWHQKSLDKRKDGDPSSVNNGQKDHLREGEGEEEEEEKEVDSEGGEDDDIYPISLPAREAVADAKERLLNETDGDRNPMQLLAPKFVAHVPVPTQKDIQDAFLRKRKKELLEKYCNTDQI